ncbi:hypothetical protein EC968_000125 [Mortierella alpina]|nr:hypothetical protein EC968_000125 [Mortierella alpina]
MENSHVFGLVPQHLAYIIYTSGSTGKPKGVMIEHQGVVCYVTSQQRQNLQIQPSSRMVQFFSLSFDGSVLEIFGTLCFGGSLHLLQNDVRLDLDLLWRYLSKYCITHALLTPSLLQDCERLPSLGSISRLLVGGEALSMALAHKLHNLVPAGAIINEYGPTEATVAATSWTCSEDYTCENAPIGRPLSNRTIYLLDSDHRPVPIGAVGEIFIGGVGIARGYLNQPDLTAARFIPDTFSNDPKARLYKTGDLARYLPDGNLVYMGRSDHQIKIRGFRIELGEIETRLHEHPLVADAVVVALGEGSNKRLVAYVIMSTNEGKGSRAVAALRSHLAAKLPEYMVPSAFVRLDVFPLTPNGKLDQRALPAPEDDDYARQDYEAPQGEVELALASIWSELLQIEKVSRHDSFFALGGHSLLAVRLMNRISILGADIPLSVLFSSPNLCTFAAVASNLLAHGRAVSRDIVPVSRDNDLPLSFAQQRLWLHAQLEGVSAIYHIPIAFRVHGLFNRTAWQQALDELYSRHEALRSVFINVDGRPQVRILPAEGMPLRYADLRNSAHEDMELKRIAEEMTSTPFNLEQEPSVRTAIVQLRDDDHVIFITLHHIVSDGWSSGIMVREISRLYTTFCKGELSPLAPLAIQYSDFAAWQREWLSGDRLHAQGEYWRTTLVDAPVLIDLPTDRPRPAQQSFKGSHVPVILDAQLTRTLKQFSERHGVTLFMTMLSAWSVVLSRLSGQDDVVVGIPSANRGRQEVEQLIGFFVNTLAMRVDLSGDPSTKELLGRVRHSTLAAYANQELSFEQVVEIVQPPRRMSHTPLFQVMFAWQNNDQAEWDLPGVEVSPYELDHDTTKFDLTLCLWESGEGIVGSLEYATSLFDRSTVERHVGYLQALLQKMVFDEDISVSSVDMLPPAERTLLVHTWNDTQESYPNDLCLHQLFEQQVERTPEAIAVVHEDQSLSYKDLNSRANSLAHSLIALGVQPDAPVAICVERSSVMIIGILAILKAGGAYVPLDPFHASNRLLDILRDASPVCLIADQPGLRALGNSSVFSFPLVDPYVKASYPSSNTMVSSLSSRNLAYIIYTSGTTGNPKGVMIEHQGVVSHITAQQQNLRKQSDDALLFSLLFGGESLPTAIVRKLRKLVPNARIINAYGPTEATVAATSWTCSEEYHSENTPIGRPLANKIIYLLDSDHRPVPIGAVGEIFIGGVGIARGYLNQPDLTAARFIPDTFSNDPKARLYKTGDLARYLPDGNLVYMGRSDHQIKIRGFRIELGEIETRLHEHPLVADAVVVALDEGSNKRLVAYVIMSTIEGKGLRAGAALRSHLAAKLPEYMVPSAFVRLDVFPLTPNGKLDQRALPAPEDDDYARQDYEAPQGEVELALASIWSELLQIEKVSRHDGFFALGGHSLLAIRMISRLNHLGFSISMQSLFKSPSLSTLAQSVGQNRDVAIPLNLITPTIARITPDVLPLIDLNQTDIDRIMECVPGGVANIQDIYALSPLQDGILFHHLMAKNGDPYLLFVFRSFKTRELLDQYLGTIQQIVNRHDILRTAFVFKELSTPAQVVWRNAPLSITELQLDSANGTVMEQLKQMFDPQSYRMDLTQAPLLRFVIAQQDDSSWVVLELLHHLVGDHSTLETMQAEIQSFYKGQGTALPPAQPYRNLVAQARLGVSQEDHKRFFKEMLADINTPSLPFGVRGVHGDGSQVTECGRMLPQDLNNRVRSQSKRLGVSVASLCHVAWALVIARTSGQQRVVFGTVLFGRMQAATSTDRAMGLFINTLPIRVDLETDSVEESVRATHSRLATLLEHEHASLALAQRCSSVVEGQPLFSALLNYRHNSNSSEDEGIDGMTYLESQERTNYPFCLSVEDFGTSLGLTVQVVDFLDADRVCGYMQESLERLVGALENDPMIPVANLEVLPKDERRLLLNDWNATHESYSEELCLHQLFEQQAARTPEAIAVVQEDQSLSYEELNTRANSLAHHLIGLGVKPDTPVAICVERSPAMVIGILAILKAGGAYVPLDPFYASDRLKDIISDAAPSVLLVDHAGRAVLGEAILSSRTTVDPNEHGHNAIENPYIFGLVPQHLAYIIYTSGTTGRPKGVMIEHQGVVGFITSQQQILQMQPSSRTTQFFSIGFDPSVLEIFSTLGVGGSLHLLQKSVRMDIDALWRYVDQHRITHVMLTPTVLQDCGKLASLNTLSVLLVCGETLPVALIPKLLKLAPCGTAYNMFIYVLDAHRNPVPQGAIGEIFIGGIGVARGYLNRPDLTAERFLADPFSGEIGARMYRTGDIGKYLPNGELMHLGRNDDQVKIRGFRIELGEIESRLYEHPLVSDAVVVALGEDSNKRLVAYVITRASEANGYQAVAALRSHLAAKLPEYMVPAAFVRLDALPLTPSGKLDRRALPAPEGDDYARQEYERPQGEVELTLATIWSDLLQIKKVSRHDSFFSLGGHSLLAVKMIARIRSMLGLEIPLRVVFEVPTIAELAPKLLTTRAAQESSYDVLLPIKPRGSRAALFCVHPSLGLGWGFTALLTRLDPDQPVYGLQARGFVGEDGVASTLDEMALDYIDQIRRIQAHGPYHLLGYSFGGMIAHTMASHLEEQGERVALLALMDTPADHHIRKRHLSEEDKTRMDQGMVALLGDSDHHSPDLINPFLERARIILHNNNRIIGAQAPRLVRGDVLIFRATVPNKEEKLWSPHDWRPYVSGNIDVCDIACRHEDMYSPEPMTIIAQALNERLK